VGVVANLVLRPLAHGAVGWWDEILNLLPPVVGSGLLIYLYFRSAKRRTAEAQRSSDLTHPAPVVQEPPSVAPSREAGTPDAPGVL
jgi:hypothetical protein